MNKNNIKRNNISPFLNKNVILNPQNKLIKNILLNHLPLLPGINFYKNNNVNNVKIEPNINSTGNINNLPELKLNAFGNINNNKKTDPIGSSIINAYYNIKVNLRKLELIKTFIISILKCNERYFKKIIIQKQSYSITERNLIIKFKDTFGQTFKQMNDIEKDIKLNESSNISKNIHSATNYVKTSVASYIDKSTGIPSYIDKSIGTNLVSKKKDFPVFVGDFIYNKYELIDKNNTMNLSKRRVDKELSSGMSKKKNEETPLFFTIFLREYNGKNKLFFKTLFNQYVQIRKNLLKYLVDGNINYGILAFSFIFDLPRENFNSETESNNKHNNNNNNNLNSYIVLNNINNNDNNDNVNTEIKVGDIVIIKDNNTNKIKNNIMTILQQNNTNKSEKFKNILDIINEWFKSSFPTGGNQPTKYNQLVTNIIEQKNKNQFNTLNNLIKGTIIKIDYNNPSKPYLIKMKADIEIPIKKYSRNDFELLSIKKPKLKLNQKISENDLLYRNVFDKQMFKDNYLKNINNKYSDLSESTKNFVGQNSTQSFSLNDIIKNNIEADYNMFDFIFNYVDPLLFDKVVDENYSIKDNISRSMDQFDLYYEQYINWFNRLKGITGEINNSNYGLNISDFERFFDKILKNVTKKTKTTNNSLNPSLTKKIQPKSIPIKEILPLKSILKKKNPSI